MQVNENMASMQFQHNPAMINHTFGSGLTANAPLSQILQNYPINEPYCSRKFNEIRSLNSGEKSNYSVINTPLTRYDQNQDSNKNNQYSRSEATP